jgi:hypothetical protein
VPVEGRAVRVLQLIGDTDATTANVAAFALHRELAANGVEVRTLALAPGRHDGLERDVPAIAPSRRSFAARGQVIKESRWADVVVLHADGALTPATLPPARGSAVPTIVAAWEDPGRAAVSGPVRRRILAAADAVIVPSTQVAAAWQQMWGHAATPIELIDAGLDDVARPKVDGAAWTARLMAVAPARPQ